MFDKTDSRSKKARELYKKYADRTIRHTTVFNNGDSVFILRPPTEAKTQKEKDEDIARSKLRFKTVGPFTVVDSTPDTVTILEDGMRLKVSIDRCFKDPQQQTTEDQQTGNHPKNIPLNLTPNNRPTENNEVVLCLLYTSPSPRDQRGSRMPSSA